MGLIKTLLKIAAINAVKKQGEHLYRKGINVLRLSLRYIFGVLILSQIFVCGLGLTLYAAFQILPFDETSRLYVMLGTGIFMTVVPLSLILWGTSKRTWNL